MTQRLAKYVPPLRIGEFAKAIGYSREQVRKWIRAGLVRTVRPPFGGARRRIPADEVVRLTKDASCA